jgi:hypothetical protein
LTLLDQDREVTTEEEDRRFRLGAMVAVIDQGAVLKEIVQDIDFNDK